MPIPSEVTFTITQQDIENGQRRTPWKCPVALALRRVLACKYHDNVTVGYTTAHVERACKQDWDVFALSARLVKWIEDYDNCVDVSEAEFTIHSSRKRD